ncbi:MAG: RNA methyltransferase [Ignavibacteriae bacterium]|nr:RNA methyltransferase [Ignavibacteriota bacterium]
MSLTKAKLKSLKELTHKKFRDEQKKFLVEGLRFVHEAASSDFEIHEAYHTPELAEQHAGKVVLQALKHKTKELHEVSARDLDAISETVTGQGIIAVVEQKQFSAESMLKCPDGQSVLVAFDGVSDPGNVGSMVRTCDWFGVNGIMIGRNSVELYNPKVLRATMGGVFHLPIADGVDLLPLISKAKSLSYKVYVTDLHGETHFDHVRYDSKSLIIFGNEAWGVSDQLKQLADVRLVIRRYGAGESLNVGVSCGIVLSSLHRLFN